MLLYFFYVYVFYRVLPKLYLNSYDNEILDLELFHLDLKYYYMEREDINSNIVINPNKLENLLKSLL